MNPANPAIAVQLVPLTSLRRQVLAWVVLMTLGVAVLLGLGLLALRAQTLEHAQDHTQSLALAVSEQTVHVLQTVEQALHALEPVLTHAPLMPTQRLTEPLRMLPFVKAIRWVDAQDRVVFDSDPTGRTSRSDGFTPGHPQWQAAHDALAHATHWIAPRHKSPDGTWPLIAAHPVYDRSGRYAGLLLATVDPHPLANVWRGIHLGEGGSIALLHRNGDGMAREPTIESALGKNFA